MDRCEAPNCKMRTYAPTVEQMKMAKNNYIISFHKFPDDPYRRQSWIDAAKKPSWKPPMFNSSLCSLHFCNDCFDENNELHDHAVPSIFFDDFGSHMREVVKKLDIECKLDDDDFSKPSRSSITKNCNMKPNVRSTIPTTDRVDVSVVHCEEVVECDESPKKLGIENISIPELDETMSISRDSNNMNPRVRVPVLDVSNNIVDIEIVNSSSGSIIGSKSKSNHDDDAASAKRIKIQKDSDKLKATLCDTLSKDTSISLSKMSTSVTVTSSPPAATPVKSNVPQSTTSVTSKPTATSSVSAASSGFSVMEPTTKNLVIQLLNIVKMANASDENRLKSGPTLNSYLVTSKCPDTDASDLCEVLPSASVILNVANYVKEIKEESFVKPDNVNIICGSPAIFLLKNITVQECDPNMNCVYVITSENLLPHLYKMKLKSGVSTKSTQQQSTTASGVAEMIIQKPLQVADLVSSANPKTVLPIQKRLCGSSDSTNPITIPKSVSNLSNSANKPASGSVSCAGPKPTPLDSISNSNCVKLSENLDAFVSAGIPPTIISGKVVSVSGKIVLKPQTSGLISHSPAAQLPVNDSVSGTPLVKIPRIDLRSNSTTPLTNISTSEIPSVTLPVSTAKTVVSNSSICYNYLTKGTANVSISNSTPAKPTTTASVSHSVTITPVKPTNSSLKSPLVVSSSVTLAKPSVNTSISSPIGTFVKPTTNPLKTPSVTITTPVVKPVFSTTPILQAIPTTPNTALARVVLPPLKSAVSTPSVAQLSVQSESINVSKTQPSFIIRGKDGALARIPSNAVRAQVLTSASSTLLRANGSPPSSILNGIPSSPALPAFKCHQPTSNGAIVTKSYTQSQSKTQLPAVLSAPSSLTFRSIQSTSFDTNLKPSEVLITYDSFTSTLKQSTSLPPDTKQTIPTIPVPNQLTVVPPLKRKWDETDDSEDDDDDDDNDPFFANCNDEEYNKEYVELQRKRISKCEANILQKEREINGLKKKVQSLKKRLNSVKDPRDTKTDEQLVEEILSKYIDSDGIQFFIGQMKISGKTYTQFRWSEDDKLFALGLLYRNPVEYNVLFQKYTLPSDKTLNKFVNRVKKAEMEDDKGSFSRI